MLYDIWKPAPPISSAWANFAASNSWLSYGGRTSWLKHVCEEGSAPGPSSDLTIVRGGSNPSSGRFAVPVVNLMIAARSVV